jgi:hypothetical protein
MFGNIFLMNPDLEKERFLKKVKVFETLMK